MFERYTEKARRTIFFARYEASALGSPAMETEHLLLGVLREDKAVASRLNLNAEAIRKHIEETTPRRPKISTSVDLPLSHESKRVLAYGAEEAERLGNKFIETWHLVLGLLREDKCLAAGLLRQNGIRLEAARQIVRDLSEPQHLEVKAEAASIQPVVHKLHRMIYAAENELHLVSGIDPRKEMLGKLIDWATTHHQWFARALTEPKLVAPGYPEDEWVARQRYGLVPWRELVQIWFSINDLLIHVLSGIPEDRLITPCRIGIEPPMPLSQLIEKYVDRCEDILGKVLARG